MVNESVTSESIEFNSLKSEDAVPSNGAADFRRALTNILFFGVSIIKNIVCVFFLNKESIEISILFKKINSYCP